MKNPWFLTCLGLIVLALAALFFDPTAVLLGYVRGEGFFQGRPTTYWIRSLTDESELKRKEALQTLKKGGASAVPIYIDMLRRPAQPGQGEEIHWTAADLLGRLEREAAPALPALISVVKTSPDPHARKLAMTAIAGIGPPAAQAVPVLLDRLDEPAERTWVIDVIGKLGPDAAAATPSLCALLKSEDSEVRFMAARSLGKIGTGAQSAVLHLIDSIKDEDPEVREHVAESLGQIGRMPELAVPALVGMLKDADEKVRRDAVRSLGQFGPEAKDAIKAIAPLVKDPSTIVQEAAKKALGQIQAVKP